MIKIDGEDYNFYDHEKNYEYYLNKAKERGVLPEIEELTTEDHKKISQKQIYDFNTWSPAFHIHLIK